MDRVSGSQLDAGWTRVVAERFALGGDCVLVGPPDRGEVGEVWRLDTDTGRYAVKVLCEGMAATELDEPAAFADAVADAGVPTARFHRATDGTVLVDVQGRRVMVLDWVDLRGSDPALDPAAVGELLARLHRVRFAGTARSEGWFSEPLGAPAWDELVRTSLDARAPFAPGLAAYRDDVVALEAVVDPLPAVLTCHRDLWADNLRALASGHLCVVDWDACGRLHPAEELAQVLFEFGQGDPVRQRSLHDAYVGAGGPARVESTRAFSMLVAVSSHLGRMHVRRWLAAAPGSRARERAVDGVEEFLGHTPQSRLDRAAISAILDAVT